MFTEGKTGCTLEDVLTFFTGADSIPPLGFDRQPNVCFLHDESIFCTASTCSIELRLPCCHQENYEAFKQAMIMSLHDNDGFGGV